MIQYILILSLQIAYPRQIGLSNIRIKISLSSLRYYLFKFMNSKEKLKNRLNVKFEPIHNHRQSLKKLEMLQVKDKSQNNDSMLFPRVRSSSQVKLPSLDKQEKKKIANNAINSSKSIVDYSDIREKVKSMRQIPVPKVKVESKDDINNTITYLMKKEILTVPMIVAMLQKNKSDEFLYMRVVGMYEFEACEEKEKGKNYVTVSKNGMVMNGELIPLETLAKENEIYKKLMKIDYFALFRKFKYLGIWKEGSKKAHFVESRKKIEKLLDLNDKKLMGYKIDLFNEFEMGSKGGWLKEGWVDDLVINLSEKKNKSIANLVDISYGLLEDFQLPISPQTALLNRVLGNLNALSISFEKKIRIQREMEKFYRLGRQYEFVFTEKIGYFLVTHIKTLIQKVENGNNHYVKQVLTRLEELDIMKEDYSKKRDQILVDSSVGLDIDFTLYFNKQEQTINIRPTPLDIFRDCMVQINAFISKMDKVGFKLIRSEDFRFILNVVEKTMSQEEEDQNRNLFKNYMKSINIFNQLSMSLEEGFKELEETFIRKAKLFSEFQQIYKEYYLTEPEVQFTYEDIAAEEEKIEKSIEFCDKLIDGEYLIFGYLNISSFKHELLEVIKGYQARFLKGIPIKINEVKGKLIFQLREHLKVLNLPVSDASSYIKNSDQFDYLDDAIPEYGTTVHDLQRIQELYHRISSIELPALSEEKKNITEIKNKMKVFRETRDHEFVKYRKRIEERRKELIEKVKNYEIKDEAFYEASSPGEKIHSRVVFILRHLEEMKAELKNLNSLQVFYNLKTTTINVLEMEISEYENLEELWRIDCEVMKDEQEMSLKQVKNINSLNFTRNYEQARKKIDRHLKDQDLGNLALMVAEKVEKFLQNLDIINQINTDHLRYLDLIEINQLIEKYNQLPTGVVKCREVLYERLVEVKASEVRSQIAEVVFKAKKQIQISENLKEFEYWWRNLKLEAEALEEYPLVYIFSENSKVRDEIDEQMTVLLNILNHKYGSFARQECMKFLKDMNSLAEMLELTLIHQEKFLDLYPILTSRYAEKQLNSECTKFFAILNKTMKNVRHLVRPTEHLNEGTRNLLNNHIKSFDSISKVLIYFLEKKRVKFQRFYFLPDDQLMEVLVGIAGETNIFRMFEGIKGWLIDGQGIKTGVIGVGDEKLNLRGWSYKSTSEPQTIFKNLEDSIKNNLISIVRNIIYQYEIQMKELKDLYKGVPWMCVYAVELILYTKQVELNCLSGGIDLKAQMSLLREAIAQAGSKPTHFSNYITLLLFLHDFTDSMRREQISSVFDFQWNSFLRFYYEKDMVEIRALGSEITWGGEYQGIWSLMVNTSDIRRAHICVLNSLQEANGVLLQGPSGTGKTQSLKELARITGKYCVVFNCSQNVNIKTLSKLLSGLCYTASWLCLDQINRLSPEAMSSIASQISSIRNAILNKKQVFNFMGKDIKLGKGVGIFATMNPIYLKRAKLTENMKSYFRVITVAIPDYEKILQVQLYGLGFSKPLDLAQLIGKIFKNLSVQLSHKNQYDFGLRAMKFLLSNLEKLHKDISETNQMLTQSFKQTYISRVGEEDQKIFFKVIADTLNSEPDEGKRFDLERRIQMMEEAPHTGIIIFGPPSSKSTLIHRFCSSKKDKVVQIFNPSSMDLKFFLGESQHGRWEQGIIEKIARESLQKPQKNQILILDSTLKSEIIENFNTLLDESKLLTLSNGTRLKVQNNFKIVMETPHLNHTSPATVTRCFIHYISDSDVIRSELIDSLLPQSLTRSSKAKRIRQFFNKFTNEQISSLGKLYKVILSSKLLNFKGQWEENHLIGVEKAIVFSSKLLGLEEKIHSLVNKDNSFSNRKSPYRHLLLYTRFLEGEFVEINKTIEPMVWKQQIIIKTPQNLFCNWLTRRSIKRVNAPILWKGGIKSGKSKSIQLALSEKKFTKIPITRKLNSSGVAKLILPQMLQKKEDEASLQPVFIVYLEDLHMGNEEVLENFRFVIENQKIFSNTAKEVVMIQPFAVVGEKRTIQLLEKNRIWRHFAEVSLPSLDNVEIKQIYSSVLTGTLEQTTAAPTFKNLVEIESQKFSIFVDEYRIKINDLLPSEEHLQPFSMIRIFKQSSKFNSGCGKQIEDFILLMFHELRYNQMLFREGATLESLFVAYSESYRMKYTKQFEIAIKNDSYRSKLLTSGRVVEAWKQMHEAVKQCLQGKKDEHISQYTFLEIATCLEILENHHGQNYCLCGELGFGRNEIIKLACQINKSQLHVFDEIVAEKSKELRKKYFKIMRNSFESKVPQAIIVNIDQSYSMEILGFAEDVMAGYQVTHLFESEDTDYMFSSISDYCETFYEKSTKSYDEICQDYLEFAHKYVRFFFVCSPESNASEILKDYPHLKNTTGVRKLPQYPTESTIQIIYSILENGEKGKSMFENKVQTISSIYMKIHSILTQTSKSMSLNGQKYFNYGHMHTFKMVELFKEVYEKGYFQIKNNEEKLQKCIVKVEEVYETLEKLRNQVNQVQPIIEEKKNRIKEILPGLEQSKKESERIRYEVKEKNQEIEVRKEQFITLREEIRDKKEEALSLLSKSLDSVLTTKRSDLLQVKNNSNPNPLVRYTFENLAIMLNEDQSWDNVRKILSDANLFSKIKGYQMNRQTYERMRGRIKDNPEWNFDNVSKAAFGIRYFYKWITCAVEAERMREKLVPKLQKSEKFERLLEKASRQLNEKNELVEEHQRVVEEISREYSHMQKEINELEEKISDSNLRIKNAETIKNGLESSLTKWQSKLEYLKKVRGSLQSYAIMLSLEINIFSTLTSDKKDRIRTEVIEIIKKAGETLPPEINTTHDIATFYLEDNVLSRMSKNFINEEKKIQLAYNFRKMPLIYDPDDQAVEWLQSLTLGQKINIVRKVMTNGNKIVEESMRTGCILIAYIDGEVDNFTAEIIKSVTSSSSESIEFNKNIIQKHKDFTLLLFTNKKSVKINSMDSIHHQVINFQISKSSLEEQLIQLTLEFENPYLFSLKSQLQRNVSEIKKMELQMEAQIMDSLLNNKKNMIDDNSFVGLVSDSKNKTEFLTQNQLQQEEHMIQVKEHYEKFRNIAGMAADIFLSLNDLAKINPLLIWNVEVFMKYFVESLKDSISLVITNEQEMGGISNDAMIGNFQFEHVNINTSRPGTAGSFISQTVSINEQQEIQEVENDKGQEPKIQLPEQEFSCLTNDIQKLLNEEQKGKVDSQRELLIIYNLTNYIKKGLNREERNTWALLLSLKNEKRGDLKRLLNLVKMEGEKNLSKLVNESKVTESLREYLLKIEDKEKVVEQLLSEKDIWYKYQNKLTLVDLLMLQLIQKPKKFVETAHHIISERKFANILDYEESKPSQWIRASDSRHPILLMMGEDPVTSITEFLSRKRYKHATLIAMGEQYGKGLEQALEKESRTEGIFIIHNLHIGANFFSFLGRLIQQFKFKPPHENFRLVLITNAHAQIPSEIVSSCHKYILEPPAGIINKMKNLYRKSELYVDHSSAAHNKLVYSLCLMHGIVTELQEFGNLGWSIPSNFTTNDFIHAVQRLQTLGEGKKDLDLFRCNLDQEELEESEKKEIDYDGLRYMIGEINYIGKMADNMDRQKMRIIVSKHIRKQVLGKNFQMWQGAKIPASPQQVMNKIDEINSKDPKFYGLNQGAQLVHEIPLNYLNFLSQIIQTPTVFTKATRKKIFDEIEPINHPLTFINSEITQYNEGNTYLENYPFLRKINAETKQFDLKSFNNPRQLFISARMEAAMKHNVSFQNVVLTWSLVPKENYYGIKNLMMEGGNINNGNLGDGIMAEPISIYFSATIKKKDKDPNKGKISIPLYRHAQRSGSINSYGENTNLLIYVYLDSKEPQDNWVVKGTALIVA